MLISRDARTATVRHTLTWRRSRFPITFSLAHSPSSQLRIRGTPPYVSPRPLTVRLYSTTSRGERLIVALASAVPQLAHLSISGIARSLMHAPELLGAYPLIPISDDSQDVFPPSPISPNLCLPELLALPNLRSLSIQDTHLGDAKWKDAPVSALLDTLVLGAPCAFAQPAAVQEHVEDLLSNPALGACTAVYHPKLGVPEVVTSCSCLPQAARSPLVVDLPVVPPTEALEVITPGLSDTSSLSPSSSGPVSPALYPALALDSHVDYLPLNDGSEQTSQDHEAKGVIPIVPTVVVSRFD
jgi:hypothetical protein